MPRYIDADDFSKRLSNPPYTIYNGEMFAEWFEECFKSQPTVDVEPKRHRGQWISTKEKMPENDTSVLICVCGHRVTAYYNHLKKAFILTEDENLYYETAAVPHWMPLPEPPEEE